MDENTPPDFLKDVDATWSKSYIATNEDLLQFKLMWEALHEVHTFPHYNGQSISPWENVEKLITNKYLDLLNQYEKITPETHLDAHVRFGSAIAVYLRRSVHNNQKTSLEEHLTNFEYDQVYKKNFPLNLMRMSYFHKTNL